MQNTQSYFENIYRKHFQDVARYAFRRVKSRQIAEDIAQETFVEAHRNIESLRQSDREIAWLLGVARRIMIRRRTREKRQIVEIPLSEAIELFAEPDICRQADFEEELQTVLQEDDVKLIVLVYREKYTIREAASMLKISVSACKMRIYRAREKLREAYKREWEGSS